MSPQSSDKDATPFHSTAAFPWFAHSMDTLWDGAVTEQHVLSDWKTMVHEWAGSIAVGGTGRLFVFQKRIASPLAFKLPDVRTHEMRIPCNGILTV